MPDQDETLPYDIYLGHIASPPQRVEIVDFADNDPVVVSSTVANAVNQFGGIGRAEFEGKVAASPETETERLERIADEVQLKAKNFGSDDEPWSLNAMQQISEFMGSRPALSYAVDGDAEMTQGLADGTAWDTPADWKPEVALLDEAKQTITADRQDQYGNAEDSFSTIGQFWTTFLRARYPRLEIPAIKGSDVALMLDLMKTARQAVMHKHDNLVDKAGYTALAARCIDQEKGW